MNLSRGSGHSMASKDFEHSGTNKQTPAAQARQANASQEGFNQASGRPRVEAAAAWP